MNGPESRRRPLKEKQYNRIRTALLLVLILLINRIAAVFPYRLDLTSNQIHTLSPFSREVLEELEEPVTVNFFLSEYLPPPYDSLHRDLPLLMESYRGTADRHVRYRIHTIRQEDSEEEQTARDYGLRPIDMEDIAEDQVDLVSAWAGMAVLQGERRISLEDMDPQGNLEYRITSAIRKLTRQSSLLLGLDEDILIRLTLSPSLLSVDEGIRIYPLLIEQAVQEMNPRFYHRLRFESAVSEEAALRAVLRIQGNGRSYERNLMGDPSQGFSLTSPEELAEFLEEAIPLLLGTGETIGYLTDHGTLPLYGQEGINNFSRLISENNEIRPVSLRAAGGLPPGLPVLIIAGASGRFSPGELEILDQYVSSGGSLALFMDSHLEKLPSQQEFQEGRLPEYVPIATGLAGLLNKYGMTVDPSYVLDTSSYKEFLRGEDGSITEIPVYYAPAVGQDQMAPGNPATKNLQGLMALRASPVGMDEGESERDYTVLFSSSENSWLMEENINLYDPLALTPPPPEERDSYPLALLRESRDGSGRIFLAGSSSFLEDSLIDPAGNTPNAIFAMNILDLLNHREGMALLRSKGSSAPSLGEISRTMRSVFRNFNRIVLPLLAAFSGLLAYRRRKRRVQEIRSRFLQEDAT